MPVVKIICIVAGAAVLAYEQGIATGFGVLLVGLGLVLDTED